ncbi:MAG: phosphoglyceromutase [Candidatus Ancillula sp.]|jgi:2,3-bisphosphoglycerate-dependent phosphoglycerate mutase|nr:phosphoglyceromutase [Candidatus Ancillula sp.]
MYKLILMRHGESEWNLKNLFTGWVDVNLSDTGVVEAKKGGEWLLKEGILPDVVHTSLLRRAIMTANFALNEAGRAWIPVKRSWRLNERHYGSLQGLDKKQIRDQHGEDLFMRWRRSYDFPPPPIEDGSEFDSSSDVRYSDDPQAQRVKNECLKDVLERALPYWESDIVPDLKSGKTVLVAAHGNSLRAIVKYLEGISDDDIAGVNIPTGIPYVYELDENLKPIGGKGRYLDPDAQAKIDAVANQGK